MTDITDICFLLPGTAAAGATGAAIDLVTEQTFTGDQDFTGALLKDGVPVSTTVALENARAILAAAVELRAHKDDSVLTGDTSSEAITNTGIIKSSEYHSHGGHLRFRSTTNDANFYLNDTETLQITRGGSTEEGMCKLTSNGGTGTFKFMQAIVDATLSGSTTAEAIDVSGNLTAAQLHSDGHLVMKAATNDMIVHLSGAEIFQLTRSGTEARLTASGGSGNFNFLSPVHFHQAVTGIVPSEVGLGNVDNTSDADKPVSTATAALVGVEEARIDAILSAADADKDTFVEIVALINSVDATSDAAFASYVISNDAAVAVVAATVTSNDTDIAANTAAIVSNDTDIAANTAAISSNDTDIAANTAAIVSNDTDIAANTAAISSNDTDIAANTAAISSNDTDIAANTAAISSNDTDIAANTAAISSNDTDIAANTAAIVSNDTDIAANTAAISSNDTDIAANTAAIVSNDTDIAANTAAIVSNDTDIAANTSAVALKADAADARFTGNTGIGTTSPDGDTVCTVHGEGKYGANSVLAVQDSSATAAGVGGGIALMGIRDVAGNQTLFGSIKATKENASAGQFGASVEIGTRANGSGDVETGFTVNPDQSCTTAGGVTVGEEVALTDISGDPSAVSGFSHLYSKSGEAYVQDQSGNATKISPHNEDGDWEYYSRNSKSGKTVRINMEKVVRKLEELTGESFIESN